MTTGTKCCIHYKDGLPYCVECEKESDQRREELHAKLAGAEIALEQARAEIERKNEELDMFLAEQQAMNAEMYVLKVWKGYFEEMGLHEDSVTYKIICAALAAERGER
jgi:hypothetical protein